MITDETLISLRSNDERFHNLFFYLDDFSFGDDDDEEEEEQEQGDNHHVATNHRSSSRDSHPSNPNNELTRALSGNTQVTAVDVDMHLDEPLNRHTIDLMAGIGQLQNLRSLRCSSSGDYAVTMAALTLLMQASKQQNTVVGISGSRSSKSSISSKLVSLDLVNFLLRDEHEGDEHSLAFQSYQDFVTAIRYHPSLNRFHLSFGFSSSPAVSTLQPSARAEVSRATAEDPEHSLRSAHYCLTPLLESLMTMPSLNSISLDGAGFASLSYLTPQGLSAILGVSTKATVSTSPIQSVELCDFDLSSNHMEVVAKALAACDSNLKVLALSCNKFLSTPGSEGVIRPLAQALRSNTRLESLTLPLQSLLVCHASGPAHKKGMTTITKQGNRMAIMEFFQSLEINHTLKRLHLSGPDDEASLAAVDDVFMSPGVIGAIRHMLQNNYGLEALHIGYPEVFSEEDWQAEIDLHTKLNSMGRGRLLRDASVTRAQWMDSFGAVQDDLSCLFHLLLLNPLLCGSSSEVFSNKHNSYVSAY